MNHTTIITINTDRYDHEIEVEYIVNEYFRGRNYYFEYEGISKTYFTRSGYVNSKEDAPKCSNVEITFDENRNKYYWTHRRPVNMVDNEFIVNGMDEYIENGEHQYWNPIFNDVRDDFYGEITISSAY